VTLKSFSSLIVAVALAGASASCGEYVRSQGRSPSQLVIQSLLGVPGDAPSQRGNTIISDVQTSITTPEPCTTTSPCLTWINDSAEVTFGIILKDPGQAGIDLEPSSINSITLNRYHVSYKRTDGRNTEGVDVPYGFDSGLTVTIPAGGNASATVDLVRNNAKKERPLISLICAATCPPMISTIAEVTFYGRDQAGNDVSATGTIGITFGDVIRAQ
jgi:hypothetical protein